MPAATPDPVDPQVETAAQVERLLVAAQAGTPEGWRRFVERYERLVWSVPRRMGFSEADAADIVQATWVLIWRHLQHVKHPGGLASWLITTTAREASRFGRRERRQREQAEQHAVDREDHAMTLPDDALERLEQIQLVRDTIASLGERCAALLARTDLEGESYKAAAKALGMPVGSVGPTRMRCLARLLDELRRRGAS